MVKAVIGEETRLSSTEDRLSRSAIPAEVGLVIGKLSSAVDRGFVFDLIPTPNNDAGEPACSVMEAKDERKKSSRSKSQSSDASSLSIDSDWVAEHARQVSRMLLGGMKVVGVYVWASDSSFKNSTMMVCQAIKGVADAVQHLDSASDEALLIHICYSPRRWSCRSCLLGSSITSSNLRPCDLKMGRVLSSLQRFRCNYSFNLRFPICSVGESAAQTFTDILRQQLANHAKDLRSANALIDGNLVHNDAPCNTDGEHEVELLFPFMKDAHVEAFSGKDVAGVLLVSGSICSYAYLYAKEPVSQAVDDIKADIIRSLRSRLDIICDEAEEDLISPNDNSADKEDMPITKLVLCSSTKPFRLPLPRRVFVPWLSGTFICDYLQPSESLEVLKDRCIELKLMENPPESSTFSEVEAEAPLLISKSFWDAVSVSAASSAENLITERSGKETRHEGGENQKRSGKAPNIAIMVGALVLLLSVILGFVFYGWE
ncbi:PREDICTED: protein odr-4 homolog [Tarenaya hassleriana]|uniref:protein odr-4 homolog n=1 Tax=Tarenaya hassleriana TaxID=28532 RepID=UPI00053C23F5|nr:PREDICTED: protein odr-4 homolog [Tarenaya hassleriana]XP_010553852.1 PREDICTED: protein odr-4 homolog [Tarenaya hassleriana]XP_010553853.1 PREDICTED: protein odr-4 homolog [Tarenaya hassleriana]